MNKKPDTAIRLSPLTDDQHAYLKDIRASGEPAPWMLQVIIGRTDRRGYPIYRVACRREATNDAQP